MNNKNYKFTGKVVDATQKVQYDIGGSWDKEIHYMKDGQKVKIVSVKPKAKGYKDFFFLSKFALNMNNLTWDMVDHLPVTDSRFWTDLRAYENGDIDLAN